MNTQPEHWEEIMDPVDIGNWQILDRIERDLQHSVTFVLRGNRIVAHFHPRTDRGVYRLRIDGDLVHIERLIRPAADQEGPTKVGSQVSQAIIERDLYKIGPAYRNRHRSPATDA